MLNAHFMDLILRFLRQNKTRCAALRVKAAKSKWISLSPPWIQIGEVPKVVPDTPVEDI